MLTFVSSVLVFFIFFHPHELFNLDVYYELLV